MMCNFVLNGFVTDMCVTTVTWGIGYTLVGFTCMICDDCVLALVFY